MSQKGPKLSLFPSKLEIGSIILRGLELLLFPIQPKPFIILFIAKRLILFYLGILSTIQSQWVYLCNFLVIPHKYLNFCLKTKFNLLRLVNTSKFPTLSFLFLVKDILARSSLPSILN